MSDWNKCCVPNPISDVTYEWNIGEENITVSFVFNPNPDCVYTSLRVSVLIFGEGDKPVTNKWYNAPVPDVGPNDIIVKSGTDGADIYTGKIGLAMRTACGRCEEIEIDVAPQEL